MKDKKTLQEELYIMIIASMGISLINKSFIPKDTLYHNALDVLTPILGLNAGIVTGKLFERKIEDKQVIKRKELLTLYKEFLTNYKELNNTLNLKNPIEIFTLFHYLLYKGYLSNKGYFTFTDKNIKDIDTLKSLDVLNGKGVCRNISYLFTDILLENNISTQPLLVTEKELSLSIKKTNEELNYEELINYLKERYLDEDKAYEIYHHIINNNPNNIKISIITNDNLPFKYKFLPNHMITYSNYNNRNYFLDPTNYRIFNPSNNKKQLIDNELIIPIRYINTKLLVTNKGYYEDITPNIKKNNIPISREEILELINNTKNKYTNNMDILKDFYITNRNIYSDISKILEKTKVKEGRIL